jgi:hypothetical protein
VNLVAPLRIVYVALSFVIGFGLTVAGVLSLLDSIQVSVSGVSYLDSPLPFSFSSHAYTPVIGAITLLSGFAALRRRWQVLELACWFLLGTGLVEALHMIWILGWYGVMPDSADGTIVAGWVLFAMLGVLLAVRGRPSDEPRSDMPASVSAQEGIRLRNTLIGLVAVSYIWRVIAIWLNPGLTYAIAYLQGIPDLYGPDQVVLSGVVGLCAAIVLAVCASVSSTRSDKVTHGALALTAGFALEGFFDTLDYFFRFGSLRELNYSLQDAVAFVACCAALTLSLRAKGLSSRPAVV